MLLVGRLVYEKGFQLALEALPGLIERVGDVRFLVAGSGTARAGAAGRRPTALGPDEHGTFLGWIGDDVLHSLYRIADLTRGAVASTSRSGWWRWRRWRPAARASSPTPAACARSCPTADVGLRFRCARPAARWPRWPSGCSTDDELRDRLVAEACEHVLRFDWADVARQVGAIYGEVVRRPSLRSG